MDKSYCSAHFETKWHIGEAKADKDTEILSQRSSIGPESSISCIGLKRKKCSTAFSDSISSQRLKTSSVVWEHFKRTEVNSVCNYCSKKYSLSTATGILQKHLKALHAGKFNPGKSMMANWIAKETKTDFWDVFQEINQKPIRECTQNLILSNRDWVLVDEVIAILEPFKFVTDELSKSSLNLTIATMIPLYQHCVSSLETEINMVLETGEKVYDEKDDMYVAMNLAKEKIIHYYDGASPILGIAAILDPRLKKERFEFWQWEEEWIATAMEHFKEAFEIYKAKVTSAKISNTDTPLNPIMPQLPIHVAIYGLPKSKMQPQKEEYERL
jgi:hypothetical protein